MSLQVNLCGIDQSFLLGTADAGGGTAEFAIATQADFDEHQHFAILHDEIDFTGLATKIPFQQVQTLLLQIDQGLIFT